MRMDIPGTRRQPKVYPSRQEFLSLAKPGSTVPVVREILADRLTPVSVYERVAHGPGSFLLESVEGGERLARYSFIGTEPDRIVRVRGSRVLTQVRDEQSVEDIASERDPLDFLKDQLSAIRWVPIQGLPRFAGGAVGFLSYDIVRRFEGLPSISRDDLQVDDAAFLLTRSLLAFDHVRHRVLVVYNAQVRSDAEAAYDEALLAIDRLVELLHKPYTPPPATVDGSWSEPVPNWTKEQFQEAVRRCKDYIYAGDAFQIVPSIRFAMQVTCTPLELYRALRSINPSPYMYFLDFGDTQVVGSSPEILATVDSGRVVVRPIAGTRPRGSTEEEDLSLEAELLTDEKERAEHIMLVDLGRNDVGRVAEYGTVRVEDLMVIERYSHVMHIVSSVSGRLAPGRTAFDAIRACFPAGTLTGAPKVRAMEIIEQLEPTRRGLYGGAVGYFSFRGDADFAIAIRTMLIKNRTAYIQAGAGVVADSDPVREYEECVNKARALMQAVAMAHAGLE